MNKLLYLCVFTVGAAVGVASTAQYFKQKYEKQAQEEIDSMKYMLVKMKDEFFISDEEGKAKFESDMNAEKRSDLDEYKDILSGLDYTKYSNNDKEEVAPMQDKGKHQPYVISDEEAGEDYVIETVYLYKDNAITDNLGYLIEDLESKFGTEMLDLLKDKESSLFNDDCVYIRNDELETDFEVLVSDEYFYDNGSN